MLEKEFKNTNEIIEKFRDMNKNILKKHLNVIYEIEIKMQYMIADTVYAFLCIGFTGGIV